VSTGRLSVWLATGLGLIALVLVALLSLRVFQHDDFMYVTTAALWPQHALYTELPFMQMPLIAWIQGTVALFMPVTLLYTALLVLSAFFITMGALVLVYVLYRKTGAGCVALLGLWILLLFNRGTIVAFATTSNHGLQFLLAMLLLAWLLLRPPTLRHALIAGVLLGLLLLAKLNSLPFIVPVLWWLTPRGWLSKGAVTAATALLVLLPFCVVLFNTPHDVWALNFTAPALNSQMRGLTGWLDNRLWAVMGEVFLLPVFLATLALWAGLLFLKKIPSPDPLLLVFIGASFVAALMPGKVYVYHFLIPYAALCLLLMQGLVRQPWAWQQGMAGIVVVSLLWTAAIGFREATANQLAYGNKVDRLDRVAEAYINALRTTPHCATRLYSMAPIPALTGTLPVTPESADGPFLQRVAAAIEAESPLYRFVDPARLLSGTTALLTGYHEKEGYEAALIAEANRRHYNAVPLGVFPIAYGEGPWMLYLPPCEEGIR